MTSVVAETADAGWSNALAAKLLAITLPGVVDVYQGSELWEQSLVDPDNRRPVDFDARASLLAGLDRGPGPTRGPRRRRPGQAVGHDRRPCACGATAPSCSRRTPRWEPSGPAADHVLAFDRGGAITLATRLPHGLAARGGWDGTTLDLPAGSWRDALGTATGLVGAVALEQVLDGLPVALLVKED